MRNPTSRNRNWLRKTTATGLLPLLVMTSLSGCVSRHLPDWPRVQAVKPDIKTNGQLYEDEVLPGDSEKIKGRFHSATADSLVLKFEDGNTDTFRRKAVRKVSTHRPIWKRPAGWLTLVGTSTFTGIFGSHKDVDLYSAWWLLLIGPPTLLAFFGSPMERIYEVPPKHRDSEWWDGSQAAESKKKNNPKW